MNRQRYVWLVAGVLALGVALRFFHLGEWSLWVDEGMTYQRAVSGELGDKGPMYSTAPLNFVITRWIILLAQPTPFWLRLFPAISGCLGVGAVMWVAYDLGGRWASLVAGLITALSPWHIDWSQNARHFSVVFLFTTVGVMACYRYWQTGRWGWLLLAGAMSIAGLATHSSAAFVLVAIGAYCVVLLGWRQLGASVLTRKRIWGTLAMLGALAAGYVPITLSVSRYLAAHQTAWNTPYNIAASIVYYTGPFELVLAGLVGIAGVVVLDRRSLLLLLWMIVPIALVLTASLVTVASGAYALPSLAATAVLLGLVTQQLSESRVVTVRIFAFILVGAVVADLTVRSALYFTTQQGNRPPWKESVHWVANHAGPNDEIYATAGIVAGYYLGSAERGHWLDQWAKGESNGRRWALLLAGDDPGDPAIEEELRSTCTLRKVFYRNTGPKRRDIEVFECPPRRRKRKSWRAHNALLKGSNMLNGKEFSLIG